MVDLPSTKDGIQYCTFSTSKKQRDILRPAGNSSLVGPGRLLSSDLSSLAVRLFWVCRAKNHDRSFCDTWMMHGGEGNCNLNLFEVLCITC